jgi:hypothetical protein
MFRSAQNVAAEFEEKLAGGREREWARGAIQEGNAEAALQILNGLAGGGLTDPVKRCSAADALVFHYIKEKLEVIEQHEMRIT